MIWSQRQPNDVPQLISLMYFSQSLWKKSAGYSFLSLGRMSSISGTDCSRHESPLEVSSTICHGPIQTAQSEVLKHLQYTDDIIVSGNTMQVFEKGKEIAQILLKLVLT